VNEQFVPVVFLTLTDANATASWLFLDRLSRFLWELTKHTKVHILPDIGLEDDGNTHAHLILCVPPGEKLRFLEKVESFRPWKAWRFKTLDWRPWESGHDTRGYVLGKHTPLLPDVLCPKRAHSCRAGRCSHIRPE
jgi:hypothetical protein